MALPALRQPKSVEIEATKKTEVQFLIVSLKNGKKLVVSSDAYHGILTAGDMYKCVFCESEMVLDIVCKERHKQSQNHKKILETRPHMEDFSDNLIRQVNTDKFYCTICNVIVSSPFLTRHLSAEAHTVEAAKAMSRVDVYKPYC